MCSCGEKRTWGDRQREVGTWGDRQREVWSSAARVRLTLSLSLPEPKSKPKPKPKPKPNLAHQLGDALLHLLTRLGQRRPPAATHLDGRVADVMWRWR